jgi:arginase
VAAASADGRLPIVLGGDHSIALGTLGGLSSQHGAGGVLWFDAHGDLNTPESSPSGNTWGMPLRMILDAGTVQVRDVALVGARNLDPPEVDFIAEAGIAMGSDAVQRALEGVDCVYVALDCDVFEPGEVASFMPESGGLRVDEVEALFEDVRARGAVVGAGLSGLVPDPASVAPLERLCTALGL